MKGRGYQEPLGQRVRDFILENNLVSGRQQLLVAVSGGQDSVCLLHILVGLRQELDIKLHIAHLNHQLRGAESEADAQYVAQLAYQLAIPATVERRDVKTYHTKRHISLEEAAREVRYDFLAQVARSIKTDLVAVGHTADDHIETILMHLIRGTGIRGLQGLQPVNRWWCSGNEIAIVRPLLRVNRWETADYCHSHRLMPRIDASNLSLSPLRNRIRHQLVPLLQGYNPRVDEALQRTARIARDYLTFLDEESTRLWGSVVENQGENSILNKEKFLELPSALQQQLLRTVIAGLLGSLKDIEARHIEEIMAILNRPAGKTLSLPGGLIFTVEYNRYLIGLDPAALSPFPVLRDECILKIPGETLFSGWRVTTAIMEREQMGDKGGEFAACLDLDKVGTRVAVRCRQPGDRFQPSGMGQLKKLGEFMIDAKVPRAWRQRIPVVCSPDHILWIVGWRIDDRVKVTESTKRVLYLEFDRVTDTGG